MKNRKYTLPRHTNLASQSSRTGAFLIDIAVCLLFTLAFFYGCFSFVFEKKLDSIELRLDEAKIASHLFYEKEDGTVDFVEPGSSFEEYRDSLSYFYLTYIPYESEDKDLPVIVDKKELKKSEYFTVEWFNHSVLQIETEGRALFTYSSLGDNELGVVKEGASAENVSSFMQSALLKAMNTDFNKLPTINKIINQDQFYNQLVFICSLLPSEVITYIIFPLILKDGSTIGKKLFKLCLATSDGYKFKNSQLIMRMMPLFVMLLALFIPMWGDTFILLLVYLTVFLVSFTLSMASPKRMSLHDFCARTIVIDNSTSIIFENEHEEEDYIANEDNIRIDQTNYGEEPEISYEK